MARLSACAAAGTLVGIAIASVAGLWWTGSYNVAADEPHAGLVRSALASIRDRSVAARARELAVPKLDSPQMVEAGARQYAEMCVQCHLGPGQKDSQLRKGLNPHPPDLHAHGTHDPGQAFWIIKHGIKMTGMPAWGQTHDDETLWSMVAFLQRLPELSAGEFERMAGPPAHPHGEK